MSLLCYHSKVNTPETPQKQLSVSDKPSLSSEEHPLWVSVSCNLLANSQWTDIYDPLWVWTATRLHPCCKLTFTFNSAALVPVEWMSHLRVFLYVSYMPLCARCLWEKLQDGIAHVISPPHTYIHTCVYMHTAKWLFKKFWQLNFS